MRNFCSAAALADFDVAQVTQKGVLKIMTTDAKNFNYLMTSSGVRYKNTTAENITYTGCATGAEAW